MHVGNSPGETEVVEAATPQDWTSGHKSAVIKILYRQINYLPLSSVITVM